jgi:2-methylisocitrate lyase-like PEP mutase family enzyme
MIADNVDIPVQADADTGYGNAVSVYNTVETFEKAGVAAVMIEDQESPKRCGHMEGKSVISMEQMCQKLTAAVEACEDTDSDLLLKARTDATEPLGLDEAVRRLNAYADVGTDYVFADALRSAEDIAYIADRVDAPLVVNMGFGIRERPTTPLLSPSELEDMGVAMVTYPRLITAAAARGMKTALGTLQESAEDSELRERPDQVVGWEELMDLMDQRELRDREQRYASVKAPSLGE